MTRAIAGDQTDAQSLKSEQGQTLVEFALILPILLVLIIGVFDFGLAFNTKNEMNFLANSAARYAEVNSCIGCTAAGFTGQCAIANYVKSTADTTQLQNSLGITFSLPNTTGRVGDPLRVTVTAPFNWLGVNLPGLPSGQTNLTSTVTIRLLQTSDGSFYTTTNPSPC